jgi:hypothetical protein
MADFGTQADRPARGRGAVRWAFVLIRALSAGCARLPLFKEKAPAADVEFAKQYLALFATRSYPAMEMGMDPAVKDPQIRPKLMQMASLFPPGEPTSVTVIASMTSRSGNMSTSNLSFQYEYPGRWLLADVVVERKGQAPMVRGVHVQPLEGLARSHQQGEAGRSGAGALRGGGGVGAGAGVRVLDVRPRDPVAGAGHEVGMGGFRAGRCRPVRLQLDHGTLSIVPLTIQLFGSTFSRPTPFDPLIITTSIPVGAIVYLIQRRDWRREPVAPSDPA